MSKSSVYGRIRAGSGIKATEEEYDIREDEEQQSKEQETLQLLVTAGYFRARIKGLSTFDKVIGGMTWCIQGCRVDIDIDLLFKENSNIGKKIALTEKIVKVLKKMKCPHRIEPHQIQGSDFIHIFPVVQWLVKLALGRRDERMADMRRFAVSQFDRSMTWADDSEKNAANATEEMLSYLDRIYRPKRKYRKPESSKSADFETQVHSTLLEYGRGGVMMSSRGDQVDSTDSKSASKEEGGTSAKEEEARIQSLMTGMSETGREGRLAANIVSSILGMKSTEMQQAVNDYQQQSSTMSQLLEGLDLLHPAQHDRVIDGIKHQIEGLNAENLQLTQQLNELSDQHFQVKIEWESAVARDDKVNAKIAKLDEQVENNPMLENLERLINLHEAMKQQEHEFKATCKHEMAKLEAEIEELKRGDGDNDENMEEVEALQIQVSQLKEQLQKARLQLAVKSREVNSIERQLDEIPSQWETQQYQRRFLELYEQIEATYSENKRLYDRYNTEEAVKSVLQREVNLLNSIHDNFEKALATSAGKEQMMKQMEQITASVKQLKLNGESQRESTKATRDQKREEVSNLVELGRQYAKMVKEFQEACRKYDLLLQRSNELGLQI